MNNVDYQEHWAEDSERSASSRICCNSKWSNNFVNVFIKVPYLKTKECYKSMESAAMETEETFIKF